MSIILEAAAQKLGVSYVEVFYKAAVANCYIDANRTANEWINQYHSFRSIHVDVVDFAYNLLLKEDIEQGSDKEEPISF